MAFPLNTTGSLSPTFVPAPPVGVAVKLPSAFALFEWFPSILREPLGASDTLSEATAPVPFGGGNHFRRLCPGSEHCGDILQKCAGVLIPGDEALQHKGKRGVRDHHDHHLPDHAAGIAFAEERLGQTEPEGKGVEAYGIYTV